MSEKFYLTSDDDCHWYVVPVDQALEWNQYLEGIYKDCNYGIPLPEGVMRVGGSPSRVHFENPVIK